MHAAGDDGVIDARALAGAASAEETNAAVGLAAPLATSAT